MIDLLLYSVLSCPDADAIILRIESHKNLNAEWKLELVETVKESVPECPWDADDGRNGAKIPSISGVTL